MHQLYWKEGKFIAPEPRVRSHFISLQKNHDQIVGFLQKCDFHLDKYRVSDDKVFVYKNDVEFDEVDEGTGFVICLHLLGYWFDSHRFDVTVESLRGYLHPNLLALLIRHFYFPSLSPQIIEAARR